MLIMNTIDFFIASDYYPINKIYSGLLINNLTILTN